MSQVLRQRYENTVASGVTWLGKVPKHWPLVALKFLVSMKSGDGITSASIDSEGSYPVFGGHGLRGYTSRFTHNGHYVVVGRQGALCGNVNYANGKFWASEHAVVATPTRDLETTWLGEMLRAMNLNQYSETAAQPGLSMEYIGNLKTVFPPLPEQKQIASFLDYETGKIDALIEKQQQLIALLGEKRQAVISHAVTKGLNPDAPMRDSGIEWLGKVPEHWELEKVAWHFGAEKGRDAQRLTQEFCGSCPGPYPVYSGQTANNGVMASIDSYDLDFGDEGVLFSTTVGAKAMEVSHLFGKFSLSQNCLIIRPRSSAFNIRFSYFGFQSLFAYERLMIPDHMQPSFRMEDFYQYRLPCPPIEEQRAIASHVESRLERMELLEAKAHEAQDLLQERRTALISAAVTGKIDVRGWKPPSSTANSETEMDVA